jgi:hypothetical protein
MLRWLFYLLLPLQFACAPLERPAELAPCTSYLSQQQLLAGNWLQQAAVWQLRQSALLEFGAKKIPLEGLLQLDTAQRKARLIAMNEMGLVMFDLELDEQGQQLHRALPQLQQQPGFAIGVATSLRQIFFQPSPQSSDHQQQRQTSQRLWRLLPGGSLGFNYSCDGELQETRQVADAGNWRVRYRDYQSFAGQRIPQQIVFNDYRHRVKLSLWLREVKRDHE